LWGTCQTELYNTKVLLADKSTSKLVNFESTTGRAWAGVLHECHASISEHIYHKELNQVEYHLHNPHQLPGVQVIHAIGYHAHAVEIHRHMIHALTIACCSAGKS
jgi:hypothetical protein